MSNFPRHQNRTIPIRLVWEDLLRAVVITSHRGYRLRRGPKLPRRALGIMFRRMARKIVTASVGLQRDGPVGFGSRLVPVIGSLIARETECMVEPWNPGNHLPETGDA